MLYTISLQTVFQSAHPHEVRYTCLISTSGRLPFQSAHPHEVRSAYNYYALLAAMFQSAHPHEVRSIMQDNRRKIAAGFNPRTRMRCDTSKSTTGRCFSAFQSAHPHEVRWQHTVRFACSECLSIPIDQKIDVF